MLRCSSEAFARCPTRKLCGDVREATFTEDSECARFNRSVMDKPMTNADRIRAVVATDEGLAECLLALDISLAEDGKEFTHLYCHGDNGCVDENEDITCNDEMRKACILRWLQQPAEPANLPDWDDRDSGLLEED